MISVAQKDRSMVASNPVVRSGLILNSNLTLSIADAEEGVDYLNRYCDAFMEEMHGALKSIGAENIIDRGVDAKRTEPDEGAGVGRGMRFRGVTFKWNGYEIDARAGVTICEGERRSKVAVRAMCISCADSSPTEMKAEDIATYFERAEAEVAHVLLKATRDVYEQALEDFVAASKKPLTQDNAPLILKDRVAYVMRAYDSSDARIDDMIEELSRGRRLPRVLKRAGYRRLFDELWRMAHSSLDQPVVVEEAIEKLRADNGTDFVFIEKPFYRDHKNPNSQLYEPDEEQRALIVSQFDEREDGVPILRLTGIMSVSTFEEATSTEQRLYASRLVSGAVVANFSSRF